ncbi:MAG TPA: hypothetical protein VMZ06_18625 [Candidatus Bathyarchaeia archaeon]|nr:hypothetical protein [Candidatus Bathyarchaeia archaeon]
MVEFEIEMPKTLPPGPTKFLVSNNSQNSHNFAIEGPDGVRTLSKEPLKPGDKGTMQINLKPGKYVVYCPVFNNCDRGMEVNLTVTAGNQITATWRFLNAAARLPVFFVPSNLYTHVQPLPGGRRP